MLLMCQKPVTHRLIHFADIAYPLSPYVRAYLGHPESKYAHKGNF